MSALRVNVADLLHHPGARRPVHLDGPLPGLEVGGARVPGHDPVEVDLVLESVHDGILAMGQVRGHWVAECSRCLTDVDMGFELELRELFERAPIDEETYPLHGEEIDLEPAVRDAVLVELPIAPVCDDACLGLCPECGADRNEIDCGHAAAPPDPRWEGLTLLRFEPQDQES